MHLVNAADTQDHCFVPYTDTAHFASAEPSLACMPAGLLLADLPVPPEKQVVPLHIGQPLPADTVGLTLPDMPG